MTLHVACVNWKNYLGQGDRYVDALLKGIEDHTYCGYEYHELTEDEIPPGNEGWWNKIALFKPGMFPRGDRVAYFDLDTVIVGEITDILEYEGPFAMLSDFYYPGKGASGVMAWTVSEETEAIWNNWEGAGRPQYDPRGDQGWISHMMPDADRLQNLFPGQIVSYKKDCKHGIPDGASVVCFHGLPRPHSVKEIMNHWSY